MLNNTNILEIRKLSKIYGNEKNKAKKLKHEGKDKEYIYKKTGSTVALWDVNLDIKEGEIFVIIGLSGSGKSTLVRCFNLLNKPSNGSILFKGEDISKYKKDKLRNYRRSKISI